MLDSVGEPVHPDIIRANASACLNFNLLFARPWRTQLKFQLSKSRNQMHLTLILNSFDLASRELCTNLEQWLN